MEELRSWKGRCGSLIMAGVHHMMRHLMRPPLSVDTDLRSSSPPPITKRPLYDHLTIDGTCLHRLRTAPSPRLRRILIATTYDCIASLMTVLVGCRVLNYENRVVDGETIAKPTEYCSRSEEVLRLFTIISSGAWKSPRIRNQCRGRTCRECVIELCQARRNKLYQGVIVQNVPEAGKT